jgi:outer membrane protein assembly factor BamD (BamD/ComL family)
MRAPHPRIGSASVALLLCCIFFLPAAQAPAQEAAERLLLEAARSEEEGDLDAALTDYEMVARQFPGTEVAARALIKLVEGKREKKDNAGAALFCNRLIDDFPGSNYSAAGLFYLAEIQMDKARRPTETEAARETYRRIWVLFDPVTHPDLIYRAAARVRNAELDLRAGDSAEAELSYLATLEGEPLSEWTGRARLGLAGIYLERGEWVLAAETLQQAINEAEALDYDELADEARIRLTLVHRLNLRPAAGSPRWVTGSSVKGLALKKPAGVAATHDARVVVTEEYPGRAVLLQDGTPLVTRTYPEAYRPFWTRDGKAWVPTGTVIWEVEGGDRRTFLGPSRKPIRIIHAGADSIYQWFTYEPKPLRVLRHRVDSRIDEQVSAGEPVDIAADSQGRLHVLDERSRGVLRFDPAGTRSVAVAGGKLSKPIALDVDPMGNIYVLDSTGRVSIFDARGASIETLGPSFPGGVSLSQPVDLAVDGTGRIYLLNGKPGALYVLE